jgi:hypothetical protein
VLFITLGFQASLGHRRCRPMQTKSTRFWVRAAATGALFTALAFHGSDAEARGHRRGGRFPGFVGAAIAGAVIGAALAPPVVETRYYYPPVYPPPPPAYPPPPQYYAPPPPAVYAQPVQYERPEFPRLGLGLLGTVQASAAGIAPVGGLAGMVTVRTSSLSLLAFELQSVRAETPDGQRDDLSALIGGRIFFWNAAFAPYFELAGGVGRTMVSIDSSYRYRDSASQLLGRLGLGLELRLGRHFVLDGELAQLHRWRLDDDRGGFTTDPTLASTSGYERALEVRGGIGFRF